MQYTLMHKEIPVLDMDIDEITGGITAIGALLAAAHLPVGITLRGSETDRAGLNHWWMSRSIPASRSGIRDALEQLGLSTPQTLLSKCYGLSLSDQYWAKPQRQELRWSQVNFFHNPFSEDVGNILFGMPAGEALDLISPDNTSDGMLKKRWKIMNGVRCLIKGGSRPFYQEPFNEVFATALLKRLGIGHVPYDLLWIDKLPYSVCPDFVTAKTELVSAHHIARTLPRDPATSKYQHYLNCCDALGISGVRPMLDRMLTVDFLLANEDRHMGNFGAIRDADTLEWIGPAPIFDCGTSLWHDYPFRWGGPEGDPPSKPFADTHAQQIRLVESFDWLDRLTLEEAGAELEQIFAPAVARQIMDEERIGTLRGSLESRVELLRLHV